MYIYMYIRVRGLEHLLHKKRLRDLRSLWSGDEKAEKGRISLLSMTALEQSAQRGGGDSLSRDTQVSPGRGPVQSTVGKLL